MKLYPAIDLIQGRCVRLEQGDFAAVTQYDDDPVARAAGFAAEGAEALHVVDLDGARAGEPIQTRLIAEIIRAVPGLPVQVGGGIREAEHVATLLESAGAARVVVGSLAVERPARVLDWIQRFGRERLVLALDCRVPEGVPLTPRIATRGWQEESGRVLWDVLDGFGGAAGPAVLATDIARDGLLEGPNRALYAEMLLRHPRLEVLASGGVASLGDLRALQRDGVTGAVIGKALYEGRFTLAEALAAVAGAA